MAYPRGVTEALTDFGLEKTAYAPAALGGLLGAGMGYLADPEHSWQAAAMGGLSGAAMGHGVGNFMRAPVIKKPYTAPQFHSNAAPKPVPPAAPPEGPGLMNRLKSWLGGNQPSGVMDAPGTGIGPATKAAADFGLNVGPSGPQGAMVGSSKERLPGMHRWVPRETIEDVYRQLDMGVDPSDVQTDNSPYKAVATGGIAGGLAGLGLGKSPSAGLAGAGVGAAAGLGAHLLGSKNRRADTQEALYGVTRERDEELKGHTLKQPQDSARESMPLTVATNIGL